MIPTIPSQPSGHTKVSGRAPIPVLGNVAEVVVHRGPHDTLSSGAVAVLYQPSCIGDQGDGPERRAVPLWPTYFGVNKGNVVIKSAGNIPQGPLNTVASTLNLGSPRPAPSFKEPEGLCMLWSRAWDVMY